MKTDLVEWVSRGANTAPRLAVVLDISLHAARQRLSRACEEGLLVRRKLGIYGLPGATKLQTYRQRQPEELRLKRATITAARVLPRLRYRGACLGCGRLATDCCKEDCPTRVLLGVLRELQENG